MGELIQSSVSQAGGGADTSGFLLMMMAMFAIFYFLLIRPQRKQQQQHQNLLAGLKKGDEVILSSGFVGKIFAVEDKTIQVELAPNMRVKVLKQAVSQSAAQALSASGTKSLESAPAAGDNGVSSVPTDGEGETQKAGKKSGKKPSA